VPIYVYRFDWDEHPSNILVDLRHLLGAAHSLETAFVSGKFENFLGLPWVFRGDPDEPARDQLSAAMMSYWAQFAYTGSPGSGRHHDLPEWERWSGEPRSAKTILFATAHAGGIRMSAEGADSERIKEQLAGDASLSVTDRCRLYVQMYSFPVNAPWQESDYRSLGCAQGADARLADEGNLTMGSSGY
jgi:para-nitrobenzyl esterase